MTTMAKGKESNKEKGDDGENLAAGYLEKLGYTILERQWKYERFEIDLIAEKDKTIVFVEVKTRFSNTYGEPWEAVNQAKRKKQPSKAQKDLRQCGRLYPAI